MVIMTKRKERGYLKHYGRKKVNNRRDDCKLP